MMGVLDSRDADQDPSLQTSGDIHPVYPSNTAGDPSGEPDLRPSVKHSRGSARIVAAEDSAKMVLDHRIIVPLPF